MTANMRRWLTDHGLTAVQVADMAGIRIRDLYDSLSGRRPVQSELRTTLRSVYGMTEAEYREAVQG